MMDDADYALLDRYLAGECSPAERQRVDQWLGADESRTRLLQSLRAIRETAALPRAGSETDELWQGLRVRLQAAPAESPRPEAAPTAASGAASRTRRPALRHMPGPARRAWPHPGLLAAAIAAIAAVVLWQTTASTPSGLAAASTYSTARAQRTTILLHDGSRVTLAASSTLDVSEGFGRREREVHLTGEAYFDVAADRGRPFRVHGTGMVAEALGTRFGVRAYPEDPSIAVVVEEGSVAVGATGSNTQPRHLVLSPGDLARVERGGRVLVERNVAVARYLGWVHGRLDFVDAPLVDAAREIGRWYDVDVIVDDSALARSTFSASFSNERLDEVISALTASVEARAEYSGRTVRLSPLR